MRKNVASQHVAGQMNARADGSPLTSSVTVYVTGDGGTQGAGAGTTTHEGNGTWDYAPTQAETNFNHIAFTFTHASGVNQVVNVYTTAADPGDSVRLGLTALPNAAAGATNGLPLSFDSSGRTNVGAIRGVTPVIDAGGSLVVNAAGSIDASVLDSRITGTILIQAGGSVVIDGLGTLALSSQVDELEGRLPSTITLSAGGVMVASINNNVITAASVAADAVTEIQSGLALSNQIGGTLTLTAAGRVDVGLWLGVAPNALISGRVDANAQVVGDKTGYSLTQAFPSNFSAMLIAAGGTVTATASGTVIVDAAGIRSAVGLSSANLDSQLSTINGNVDQLEGRVASTISLNAGGTLTLGATGATVVNTGTVTVGTNNDKTGYSLTQTFPSNFSSMSITASGTVAANVGGSVTVGTNNDKTGYAITTAASEAVADVILGRHIAGGSNASGLDARNVTNTLRAIRNRTAISGGTVTVYEEDDATTAWTGAVTTTAGNPVTEINPT